jgi:hypothetical protein
MSDDKQNPRTLEHQFAELGRHMDELIHKLETATKKEAEAIRPKLKAVQDRLHEFRQNSGEAWEDLKPGMKKAWDELQKSFSQAATRFKSPPSKE